MPKSRETCTECSVRRQKCDKGNPCGRCVKRGIAARCTREWTNHSGNTRSGSASSTPARQRRVTSTTADRVPRNLDGPADSSADPSAVDSGGAITTLDFMAWTSTQQDTDVDRQHTDGPPALPQVDLQQLDDSQHSITMLQLLLPGVEVMWKLVNFHEKKLLWYHGCYHGPTFNTQLEERIQRQNACGEDVLQIHKDELQWTALLFSILAGSMTSAGEDLIAEWGFIEYEAIQLCSQWYLAATTSLKLGNYTADHNIVGAQAVATLTMCAHTLGFSGDLHVHLGAAIRIAQSLNLHRIKADDAVIGIESSAESRNSVMKKEIGRRLWSQLCIQDWFSIPLAEAHSIHLGHFTTRKPGNRDHLTMELLDDPVPTYVSYSNYLYDIAALIAEIHGKTVALNTDYARYKLVMEYDTRMRQLATTGRPHYFDVTVPVLDTWPWFVPWARRSLTICFAHKIMMIHRAFLKRSFTNSAFSFTRRTCIAASKTILNEARSERQKGEPIIWIDHAFCIAAAITLALDICHRQSSDPDFDSHKDLVEECILMLRKQASSTLAQRGIRVLHILLRKSCGDVDAAVWGSTNNRVQAISSISAAPLLSEIYNANIEEGAHNNSRFSGPDTHARVGSNEWTSQDAPDQSLDDMFAELFPPQAGFSNAYLFEELLDLSLER